MKRKKRETRSALVSRGEPSPLRSIPLDSLQTNWDRLKISKEDSVAFQEKLDKEYIKKTGKKKSGK